MKLKESRPSPVEEAKWGLAVIEDTLMECRTNNLFTF